MQDLENHKRRKKKSILSKLAASSEQSSPRGLSESPDPVGDSGVYHSDDYAGLPGVHMSNKPKLCPLDSESYSHSELAKTELSALGNDDNDDVLNYSEHLTDLKKTKLDYLNGESYDDADEVIRWGPREKLRQHDVPSPMDEKLSSGYPTKPQQHLPQDFSEPEDDEPEPESEKVDTATADNTYDQNFPPLASAAPVPNSVPSVVEPTLVEDDDHQQAESSSLTSAMMKVFGFVTRSQVPAESGTLRDSVSTLSGTATKMSTKDARNRFAWFCLIFILETHE